MKTDRAFHDIMRDRDYKNLKVKFVLPGGEYREGPLAVSGSCSKQLDWTAAISLTAAAAAGSFRL